MSALGRLRLLSRAVRWLVLSRRDVRDTRVPSTDLSRDFSLEALRLRSLVDSSIVFLELLADGDRWLLMRFEEISSSPSRFRELLLSRCDVREGEGDTRSLLSILALLGLGDRLEILMEILAEGL